MPKYVGRFNRFRNDPKPGIYEDDNFIGPLPNLPSWETDIVEYVEDPKIRYVISYVLSYDPSASYNITERIGSGKSIANVPANKLKLLQRGPLWAYEHNEPLHFSGIEEEANFYILLGRTEGVENSNHRYDWSQIDALRALQKGQADAVVLGNFGNYGNGRVFLIKYLDKEVGHRVRWFMIDELKKALGQS